MTHWDSHCRLKPTSFSQSKFLIENHFLCLSSPISPSSIHLISLQGYFLGPNEFIRVVLELCLYFHLALEHSRMSEFVSFFANCHLAQSELSHSPRLCSDLPPSFVSSQFLL